MGTLREHYVLTSRKFTLSQLLYITHTLCIHQRAIVGCSWQLNDASCCHITAGKLFFFYQLASSAFITSVTFCATWAIRDSTTHSMWTTGTMQTNAQINPREFHFVVIIWDYGMHHMLPGGYYLDEKQVGMVWADCMHSMWELEISNHTASHQFIILVLASLF